MTSLRSSRHHAQQGTTDICGNCSWVTNTSLQTPSEGQRTLMAACASRGYVRHHGVASALLERAHAFAGETGASRVTLSTARNNRAAIALYEKHGWKPDEFFLHYYRLTH